MIKTSSPSCTPSKLSCPVHPRRNLKKRGDLKSTIFWSKKGLEKEQRNRSSSCSFQAPIPSHSKPFFFRFLMNCWENNFPIYIYIYIYIPGFRIFLAAKHHPTPSFDWPSGQFVQELIPISSPQLHVTTQAVPPTNPELLRPQQAESAALLSCWPSHCSSLPGNLHTHQLPSGPKRCLGFQDMASLESHYGFVGFF